MTTTASDRQPSTPGQALRWAADELKSNGVDGVSRYWLRRWADELDAAPTTYSLPAEPPETVTELWDRDGDQWDRYDVYGGWSQDGGTPGSIWPWPDLLAAWGPLSTAPPAGTEGPS